MSGVLLMALAGVLWAMMGAMMARSATRSSQPMVALALASILFALVAWAGVPRWQVVGDGLPARAGILALVMIGAGVAGAVSTLLAQAALGHGQDAVAWTLCQSSLVVPAIVGVCVAREDASCWRIIGIASIVVGLACLARAGQRQGDRASSTRWRMAACLAFLTGALQQVLCVIPSWWAGWQDVAHVRVPLLATGSAGTLAGWMCVRRAWPTRADVAIAALMAVTSLAGQIAFFAGIDRLPAPSTGYPMAIGVCIAAFALLRVWWYGDRLGRTRALGIACSVAGVAGLTR